MGPVHAKLQGRVAAAARRYAAAAALSRKAINDRRDMSCRESAEAIEEALRLEHLAHKRYREALDAFARFVLDGIEPTNLGPQA